MKHHIGESYHKTHHLLSFTPYFLFKLHFYSFSESAVHRYIRRQIPNTSDQNESEIIKGEMKVLMIESPAAASSVQMMFSTTDSSSDSTQSQSVQLITLHYIKHYNAE